MKAKDDEKAKAREIKTQLDQKKEILRLKKDIQEKNMMQSQLDLLQA